MNKTVLALVSALLLLLGSCSSLPLPGTPTESLLIFPVEIDRNLGGEKGKRSSITLVSLELRNIETGKTKKMTLIPGDNNYFSVQVEPGRYQLENEMILSISQSPGNNNWNNSEFLQSAPILVNESIVYISPSVLKVESNGKGGYSFDSYSTSSTDDPVRKKSFDTLRSERRFKAWELYQLVGWDTRE